MANVNDTPLTESEIVSLLQAVSYWLGAEENQSGEQGTRRTLQRLYTKLTGAKVILRNER